MLDHVPCPYKKRKHAVFLLMGCYTA
jgi:hypothetical protein